jgi:catechol 2,3-dioxygenase
MTQPHDAIADLADEARRDADPVMSVGIAPPGWRLPAVTRLGHVSLQVADLARSLEYYQAILGLRILESTSATALLGTMQGDAPLVALAEKPGARPVPQHGRLGLYHFAVLLPDRPALGRFVAHLASLGHRFGASDHLVSEALYLRDPDGLGIEVYADRPRNTWHAIDRQLQMASEPLDLDNLVQSARNEPWSGMPAATTMGHVHLHVADLDEASAFFHSALGFDKMVWSYQGALFLAAGGYHHHLGLNTWAGASAPRPTEADARLLEWRIILPPADAQHAATAIERAGHVVTPDGDTWLATDPWGTRVRLVN